jgi:hypothetical protein
MPMKIEGSVNATVRPVKGEIRAVVTRADGTVEDYGRISQWNEKPLRNWWGNVMIRLHRWWIGR